MIKDTIFCCGERNNKPATNRMADVAAIFGLKFGEKFKLKEYGHIVEVPNYDGGWDEKEAIELALAINAECEKRDATDCRGCPFLLEDTDGYQESFCSITNIQEIGTERLIERLKQLDSISDNVNSPAHYKCGGMECIDAIRALCEGLDGVEAYYVGNILKYIWRFKHKNGVEDLKKARKYLDWLIEQEEKESETKM